MAVEDSVEVLDRGLLDLDQVDGKADQVVWVHLEATGSGRLAMGVGRLGRGRAGGAGISVRRRRGLAGRPGRGAQVVRGRPGAPARPRRLLRACTPLRLVGARLLRRALGIRLRRL